MRGPLNRGVGREGVGRPPGRGSGAAPPDAGASPCASRVIDVRGTGRVCIHIIYIHIYIHTHTYIYIYIYTEDFAKLPMKVNDAAVGDGRSDLACNFEGRENNIMGISHPGPKAWLMHFKPAYQM